jgi:hypothetical protein
MPDGVQSGSRVQFSGGQSGNRGISLTKFQKIDRFRNFLKQKSVFMREYSMGAIGWRRS